MSLYVYDSSFPVLFGKSIASFVYMYLICCLLNRLMSLFLTWVLVLIGSSKGGQRPQTVPVPAKTNIYINNYKQNYFAGPRFLRSTHANSSPRGTWDVFFNPNDSCVAMTFEWGV